MLVLDVPKKKTNKKLPPCLVFEVMDGIQIPYKGYKEVLAKKLNPESIMGSSAIQSILVSILSNFINQNINRKKYFIAINESGLHLDKGNNLSLDLAVFEKPATILNSKYFHFAPRVVIEVDVKADFTVADLDDESSYIVRKSTKMIDFGVELVIWITTKNKSIYIVSKNERRIVNFDETIHILELCNLNLEVLLKEEEFIF